MEIKSVLEQEVLEVLRSLTEKRIKKVERDIDEDLYIIGEVNRHEEVIIRIGGCTIVK